MQSTFTVQNAQTQQKLVKVTKQTQSESFSTRTSTSFDEEDDDDSYNSSDYSSDGSDCEEGDEKELSVEQIAEMLGSVEFNEFVADPSQLSPHPRTSSCDALPNLTNKRSSTILRSESMPGGTLIDEVATTMEQGPDPTHVLNTALRENGYECSPISSDEIPDGFFEEITEENIKSYTIEILAAVRSQDISELERMFADGHCMQCCNKFGESILHLACRRGFVDVVKFLVEKAGISINIRDDYGRTPLHDACWVSCPSFDLVEILVRKSPDLLLIGDKRGFTPLQYAKKDSYSKWCQFFTEKKDLLIAPKLVGSRRQK